MATFGGLGSTNFGQPQQQSSFAFGQQQPQQQSSFSFGQHQPQQQSSFNFGKPQQQPSLTFGQQQPQQQSSFNFGQQPQQQAPFSFAPKPQQPSLTFGQPQTQTAFGQPQPASTSTAFSFGQPQPSQQSGGLFGNTTFGQQPLGGMFGHPQPQPQPFQQPMVDEATAFHQSVILCSKYGDERDNILVNFNRCQARWGHGKGYYNQALLPITYTQQNPMYMFKAVGYSFIQKETNEDGNVTLEIRKPFDKVRQEETALITALQQMAGRPNIFFKILGIKKEEENVTTVILFAEDRSTLRRIPATDLAGALRQPHLQPHLDQLGIGEVLAKIRPSPEQLNKYLKEAPSGLDSRVWKQAQEDNPDPENMIPTVIVGIDQLKQRAERQETETQHQITRISMIGDELTALQNRHTTITAELQQLRRKQVELSHRLLSVLLRQEVARKDGSTIQIEEEELSKNVHMIDEQLSSPVEYKGRLNELLSQVRLKQGSGISGATGGVKYAIDDATLAQIRAFLIIQQESVKKLVSTVREDLEELRNAATNVSDSNRRIMQI